MILHYALGGGLGHIARSLALIAQAPPGLRERIRLLVSSRSAGAARPICPCPLDIVPDDAMATSRKYARFFDRYIAAHHFSCLVLDTFPFGLVGELSGAAPALPRVLVGRYLRWDAYMRRVGPDDSAIWPTLSLMIEEQSEEYIAEISRHSRVLQCNSPLSLARPEAVHAGEALKSWCVVHSGSPEELAELSLIARRLMAGQGVAGDPVIITPEQGIFPLELDPGRFSDVVAGAGYASCAAAKILEGRVRYHLHPFQRRYDDQGLRLQRLRTGVWGGGGTASDRGNSGPFLWDEVRKLGG